MSKATKVYVTIIILLLVAVIFLWQSNNICWKGVGVAKLEPSVAITIWAALLTIVFLVFSLLGLINIDHKLSELNKTKVEMQNTSLEMREQLSKLRTSSAEEREKIINGAEAELKKIINESTVRQNLFDELGRIAANPAPDKRVQGYAEILKFYPNLSGVNYAFIHIRKGDAFLIMGKFDKALMEYEEAVKLSPKEATCYNAIGYLYAQMKNYPKSIEFYQKALELKPESDSILMNIANNYAVQGKHEEAKKYFDRALNHNPDLAEAFYNKSLEYNETKDPMKQELKLHYLDHCLELNPLFIKARIAKACTFKEQSKFDQAIDECSKVVSEGTNEDYVMALIERGYNYLKLNQNSLALLSFQHAFFFDPHNVQVLHNLAVSHLGLLELNKSYQFLLQAFYEAERQNCHEFDKEMIGLLDFLCNNFKMNFPYGPDNIKEYVDIRMKSYG